MGLTLFCKDKNWSCSYSGVQYYRVAMIEASLEYVKQLQQDSIKSKSIVICPFECDNDQSELFSEQINELILFLQSLLNSKGLMKINYQPWQKTPDSLFYFGLGGLKDLVDHSDCEGYHSPGQSLNILELYSKISENIKAVSSEDVYLDVESWMDVFRESFETKTYVYYS
jgi:hypothetical protein